MFWFLKSLFSPSVNPMNVIRLRRKVLLENIEYLQSLQPQAALFPVLKSNAYGHGLKQVVRMLRNAEVPYIAVDSYPEYITVTKLCKIPVLIMGETLLENYRKFDVKKTTFCVYNVWTIRYLGRLGKPTKIHLFFNTGMNREGIQEDELSWVIKELQSHPNLLVEWVMSHFFDADELYESTLPDQIARFKRMYYKVLDAWFTPERRHIGNSAAMFKIKDDFFNAYRPGIALYGYNPLRSDDPLFKYGNNLLPVLSITSRVISLQTIWPGEWVSYHHEYRPSDRETVATVPFGYAEWLSRTASGKIFMKHRKSFFRQVGLICMNLSSYIADTSVHIGDEIEIISDNPRAKNSLQSLADASGTIVYETLVKLDRGIRREII
jgi:alanine racemase